MTPLKIDMSERRKRIVSTARFCGTGQYILITSDCDSIYCRDIFSKFSLFVGAVSIFFLALGSPATKEVISSIIFFSSKAPAFLLYCHFGLCFKVKKPSVILHPQCGVIFRRKGEAQMDNG